MRAIFSDIPEAIDNVTDLVAKIEKYKLDHEPIMRILNFPMDSPATMNT
jgi:DNA polymerase III alpha subunit